MWQSVEDNFEDKKIQVLVDCARHGRLDGTLLYDGKEVSKFGIDITFEDGEETGFSIDVPFRKSTEMFDDDDVIGMIEYGLFDSDHSDQVCDAYKIARGGE